ncbi:putative SOS response-associated peptidase YedK [Microbacterium resistens]|uniref:SOS response-associated peptidase YedK n=1 Tax=Microbacterium resistens TaxID=156977 RepID=A0ABU1SH92_9MICO|nr:SOS response-associated peptidase family protein [Microbacterium resistens]MDR6868924.1 putative SOS response-associated peptidase YedK [Microbacterium resistens]
MCASYGIDPRFDAVTFQEEPDEELVAALRTWAERNAGEILRPTGRNRRNLNPLIVDHEGTTALELGWWGFLENGAPAGFATINTRSERLARSRGPLPARAIVPVSYWREMTKPSRVWHHFTAPEDGLLGLAAVTRPGRTADGTAYTCYSIVMRPAAPQVAHIHDRMPLLINPGFAEEWLRAPGAGGDLIDAAVAAAAPINEMVRVAPARVEESPEDPARLF